MNAAWTILAVAMPLWVGLCVLRMLWNEPAERGDWGLVLLRATMVIGIGWFIASAHYLAWRACGEPGLLYRLTDCLILPALAWWGGRSTGGSPVPLNQQRSSWPFAFHTNHTSALLIMTVVVAIIALCAIARQTFMESLGQWDAWAIWNLKARFMYRGGLEWTAMFSREIWFSHPDYPLLLPSAVARMWTYMGHETPLVPQLTSIAYSAMVMAMLFGGLLHLRGLTVACVGVLLLAGTDTFVWWGAGQMADVPLTFYVLGAVMAMFVAGRERNARLFVLAGLLAGMGAFVKNEGAVLCGVLVVGVCVSGWVVRGRGDMARPPVPRFVGALLLLGMLAGLGLAAGQKMLFGGETYLVADQPSSTAVIGKATDPARHKTIIASFLRLNFGPHVRQIGPVRIPLPRHPALILLILLPMVFGVSIDARDRFALMAAGTMLALGFLAYYLTFLIMPYDLADLMESFPRIQLHTWPALILTMLIMVRAR